VRSSYDDQDGDHCTRSTEITDVTACGVEIGCGAIIDAIKFKVFAWDNVGDGNVYER